MAAIGGDLVDTDPTDDAREQIDAEVARFVEQLQGDWARFPELATASLPRQRQIAEEVRSRWSAGGPVMVRREDLTVETLSGSVRLRLLSPRSVDAAVPATIYIHGGGFTSFSIDTHDRIMREYAARLNSIVIGIDYSLSPEAKFPVALNEITAAIDWIDGNAKRLGIDRDRLSIGGDSAGANLAVATCLTFRDRGTPDIIKAMILNYGFFSNEQTFASNGRHGADGMLLTNVELQAYADNYLGGTPHARNPLAWPILADLHDLPPSFHAIADCDPLADGDRAMANRFAAAGNAVTHVVYRGATHSYLEAVSISALARQTFDDQARWLSGTVGIVLADAAL